MSPVYVNRLQAYKNQGKNAQMKQWRMALSVTGRRQLKDQDMKRRRQINAEQVQNQVSYFVSVLHNAENQTMGSILLAVEGLVKILTITSDCGTLEFVSGAGLAPLLTEFLDYDDLPELQAASVSFLGFLMSGCDTMKFDSSGVAQLVRLLLSTDLKVVESSVCALGQLAREGCPRTRILLNLGVLDKLLSLLNCHAQTVLQGTGRLLKEKERLIKNILFTITDLCCDHCLTIKTIKRFISATTPLLKSTSRSMVSSTCAILCCLTKNCRHLILDLVDLDLMSRLVELLSYEDFNLIADVLRILARILVGQMEPLSVEDHLLSVLSDLLNHPRPDIVQESLCIVGIVAARSWEGVQSVIDAGLISRVIRVLNMGGIESRRLAAMTASNLCSRCVNHQLDNLLDQGLPQALCRLICLGNIKITCTLLESLQSLFKIAEKGSQEERLKLAIIKSRGLKYFNELKCSRRKNIREIVLHLIQCCL